MSRLNFAKVPFRNERLPGALYGLAAAGLLATTVVHAVVLTRYLMREQEELDVKVASLQEDLASLDAQISRTENELRSQRSEAGTEKIRFLARLYYHKNFSWTGLFNELEVLTPPAVRITSIAPGPIDEKDNVIQEETQVQLQIVARSLEDILEMVRRLENNPLFTWVLPLSEDDRTETDDGGFAANLTLRYLRQDDDESEDPLEPEENIAPNENDGNIEGDPAVLPTGRESVPEEAVRSQQPAARDPKKK
jgi:Tfp pilus assembly protein PilN